MSEMGGNTSISLFLSTGYWILLEGVREYGMDPTNRKWNIAW